MTEYYSTKIFKQIDYEALLSLTLIAAQVLKIKDTQKNVYVARKVSKLSLKLTFPEGSDHFLALISKRHIPNWQTLQEEPSTGVSTKATASMPTANRRRWRSPSTSDLLKSPKNSKSYPNWSRRSEAMDSKLILASLPSSQMALDLPTLVNGGL